MHVGVKPVALGAGESQSLAGPRAGGHVIIFSLGKTAICLCEMILLALWAPGMLASHE